MCGKIAIANAKQAYQHYQETLKTDKFRKLLEHGAKKQRLLWASTGTKSPEYSDVLYIEQLIGKDTVNTVPPKTLDAFLHHGEVCSTLDTEFEKANRDLATLEGLGVDLADITQTLEIEGVASFSDSYQQLLEALNQKCMAVAKNFAAKEA